MFHERAHGRLGEVRGPILALGLAVSATIAGYGPASGQDVELWGELNGTRPPETYFEQLRADPDSYRFQSEGRERLQRLRGSNPLRTPTAASAGAVPSRVLGPPGGPIAGIFRFPLGLGTVTDGGGPAYTASQLQAHFFSGPNAQGPTLPEFYDEISGGLVALEGETFDWQTTGMTRAQVTMNGAGLSATADPNAGVGSFIERIVMALDQVGVDWSRFDQTGDGYVDVMTVIFPDSGAECRSEDRSNTRVWSHRWNLAEVTGDRLSTGATGNPRDGIRTSTPFAGGGYIYVNDYTIQPLLSCDGGDISEIGTFAHELGHAFGLPDLYRTGGGSFYAGVGNWDLMGTGSYGCAGGTPERPCHPGAWTKSVLGWVTVDDIAAGSDEIVDLEPVETGHRVLRLPSQDGSGEYVLLENRQRIGTDLGLPEPGLLIWQIDPEILGPGWPANRVNSNRNRLGVGIRQADGREDLTSFSGGRGDRGDPFPGCVSAGNPSNPCVPNPDFHAGELPYAVSHLGSGLATTLTDIESVGAEPSDIRFRLNTERFTIVVDAEEDGVPRDLSGFFLDGVERTGTPFTFPSVPFESHEIVAAGGIPTAPGHRIGFLGWTDAAERSRTFVTGFAAESFTATYGGEQIRLAVSTNNPGGGVPPGSFVASPGDVEPEADGFWFEPGTPVSVTAMSTTGFSFLEWVGVDPPGQNPISFVLNEPTEITATFDLLYALQDIQESYTFEAAAPQDVQFSVVSATDPVTWSLVSGFLPPGMTLSGTTGRLTGTATETGDFPIAVRATDATGLQAEAEIVLTVALPTLSLTELASTFVTPGGSLTILQQLFFDGIGNGDGTYDVGDFRSFHLSNPGLPEEVPPRESQPGNDPPAAAQMTTIVIGRTGEMGENE